MRVAGDRFLQQLHRFLAAPQLVEHYAQVLHEVRLGGPQALNQTLHVADRLFVVAPLVAADA